MEEQNKNIFDEYSSSGKAEQIDMTEEVVVPEPVDGATDEMDFEFNEFSDNVKKEVILKEEDVKKVFTISKVEKGLPRLKDEMGNFIAPKPFNDKKPDSKVGYETKLKIEFEDSNYIALVPNIKWYPGIRKTDSGDKKVLNPWFRTNITADDLDDKFVSEISKLYYRFCVYKGVKPGMLSISDFITGLVGCKVELSQYKVKYQGEVRYRIDISKFIQ